MPARCFEAGFEVVDAAPSFPVGKQFIGRCDCEVFVVWVICGKSMGCRDCVSGDRDWDGIYFTLWELLIVTANL